MFKANLREIVAVGLILMPPFVGLVDVPVALEDPGVGWLGTAAGAAEQQPAPRSQRPPEPFAGEPRLNGLVVSGGCCHDYISQAAIVMTVLSKAAPIDWTVVNHGGTGFSARASLYDDPQWFKGYHFIVHNECYPTVTDEKYLDRIAAAHKTGIPGIFTHCSFHSYRDATADTWREVLGATTHRHTRSLDIPIALKPVAPDHVIMQGFKEGWTPREELYIIEKLWPGAKALATAANPEEGNEKVYPVIWVHEYHGTRVFSTSLGHKNETWSDPVFQELLTRGFKWALRRE